MEYDTSLAQIPALLGRMKNPGRPMVGCLPLYPPVELFTAAGCLPVVLWHLSRSVTTLEASDRHLQNFACSIARELTQFVLADAGTCFDGLFAYNACDTIRNLPEVLDLGCRDMGRPVPILTLHLPQVNRCLCDPKTFLGEEISRLIQDIRDKFGLFPAPGAFLESTVLYARMRSLCRDAETLVGKGMVSFSDFIRVASLNHFLPVADQIARLETLISGAVPGKVAGTRVLVSGILPPPPAVVDAMENAGLVVAANDIASLRRSYGYDGIPTDDPGAYYTDLFENRFPCTTLLYRGDDRVEAFLDLVESTRAGGVVFSGIKFCEYEYFEFPYLQDRLKELGIPWIELEFEGQGVESIGAYTTRVEAFSEMIRRP